MLLTAQVAVIFHSALEELEAVIVELLSMTGDALHVINIARSGTG